MSAEPDFVGYLYPEPFWHRSQDDWVKSLLLVFDSVGVLVPRYMNGRLDASHWLTHPMREQGLLHVIEPETFVDLAVTEKLGTALVEMITGGFFDGLTRDDGPFAELSMSRLGGSADAALMEFLVEELSLRGLASASEDGVSIPMHPMVRTTVLVLLAQLAPARGRELGFNLQPITGDPRRFAAFRELFDQQMPTAGRVATCDLETVGVDLGGVPLDDVLAFRKEHLGDYKKYMREVRSFVTDLSTAHDLDEAALLDDRREAIIEAAAELRATARSEWKLPFARFAVGAAGAAWTLKTGDPAAAVFGGLAALLEFEARSPNNGPFSYLLAIENERWYG